MKRWIPSDDETGDRATNQKNESSLFDGHMQRLYSLVNDHQINLLFFRGCGWVYVRRNFNSRDL